MTSKNKILILGVSGMLGNTLYRYFRNNTENIIVGVSRNLISAGSMFQTEKATLEFGFEAENIDALTRILNKHRPDIVINCVGIIKQKATSEDPLFALHINSLLPHRLNQLCTLLGSRLIHISTDCVFSGQKGMYKEDDVPDARDLYGTSKLLGEVVGSKTLTLRTSLIGHELDSSNSLVNWFLSRNENIQGYRKAIFSGLPCVEVASIINNFVIPDQSLNGLMHLSVEPIDKYLLLSIIKSVYGKNIEIEKDNTVMLDRSLDSSYFRRRTGYVPPSWKDLITAMRNFH